MSRRRLSATPVLLAAMAAAAAYIVVLGSKLSFLLDDWGYIVLRRGNDFENWVRPDNEHFVAGPVTIWKLLIAVFGIDSMLPYKLVSTALFLRRRLVPLPLDPAPGRRLAGADRDGRPALLRRRLRRPALVRLDHLPRIDGRRPRDAGRARPPGPHRRPARLPRPQRLADLLQPLGRLRRRRGARRRPAPPRAPLALPRLHRRRAGADLRRLVDRLGTRGRKRALAAQHRQIAGTGSSTRSRRRSRRCSAWRCRRKG